MTRTYSDPDFDPRIADWLEGLVDRAPSTTLPAVTAAVPLITQRRPSWLPWRNPTMTRFALLGAAAALVAAVGITGLALTSRSPAPDVGGPSPSSSPSQPAESPAATGFVSTLTDTFTSPLYRYSINVDPAWTIVPATVDADDPAATDANASDHLAVTGTDTRIDITANDLGGQTFDAWLADIHQAVLDDPSIPGSCKNGDPSSWPAQPVGSASGVLMTLCNFAQVFVEVDGQAYTFTWGNDTFDGASHLDVLNFKRALDMVTFGASAGSSPAILDQLTAEFTSPLYGYSIGIAPDWTAVPAVKARTDPLSEETYSDTIAVTGTDSSFGGAAAPLGDRTWDELLAQLSDAATSNMPPGCDGGDVSAWPTVDVGGQEGRLQQFCNAAAVYVLVDNDVFEFGWGNTSFEGSSHFPESDFLEVLKSVRFNP